jgi:hypothetical protein
MTEDQAKRAFWIASVIFAEQSSRSMKWKVTTVRSHARNVRGQSMENLEQAKNDIDQWVKAHPGTGIEEICRELDMDFDLAVLVCNELMKEHRLCCGEFQVICMTASGENKVI